MGAAPERLGRYRLLEKLGQGGMATVYRAHDDELGREVALKLMHSFLAENQEASARFAREARAVAALRHPNVLAVHDYAPEEGERPAYLVTELIRGPTLRGFMERSGAPLPEVAAMIGVKLGRALAAAHREGIVHRDVKPENVMVDHGGRVVLCDFGIAHLTAVDSTMTKTGAVIGSPAYMSPEQAEGTRELDCRSDLFSLGTVLYVLGTGSLPFQGKDPFALMARIHRGEHLPPTAKNPRVPPYFENVIERCLRVAPEARPESGDEVADALESGLRSDGMGETDRELASYFADPPSYNAEAEPRIIAASLAQARAAAAAHEVPRALALCNRVLAWRPNEPAAQALVVQLGRSSLVRRTMSVGAAALLLVGLVAVAASSARRHANPSNATAMPIVDPSAHLPNANAPNANAPNANAPNANAPNANAPNANAPNANAPNANAPYTTPPNAIAKVAVAAATLRGRDKPLHRPSLVPPTPAEPPPTEPPQATAPPLAPQAPAPVEGNLLVRAKPYCLDGLVDDHLPIEEGRALALAPGAHRVRCGGPGKKTLEREVQVVAGRLVEVKLDFIGETEIRVQLSIGDAVRLGDDGKLLRTGAVVHFGGGIGRDVHLYRAGQEIAHSRIDILPGACVLTDDPLECRKP